MSFIDSLTSEKAKQDARDIKSRLGNQNLSTVDSFLQLVSRNLSIIAFADMSSLTISRNWYEMNKMVRKRNGIYKAIKDMNAKYQSATEFFENFSSADQELISKINQIQAVIFSLNYIYQQKKYTSKELVSVQRGIGLSNHKAIAAKELIDDFRAYFTGGTG
jgi:hypothetical protein